MTREEQIKQAAEKSSERISDWVWNFAYRAHFIAGAEWADLTMIEKACEWLDNELPKHIMVGREGRPYISVALIDEFKKAMKGD